MIFHCLWQCSQIKKFWEEVKQCIEEILEINLQLEPKLFLLGIYLAKCNIRKLHRFSSRYRPAVGKKSHCNCLERGR